MTNSADTGSPVDSPGSLRIVQLYPVELGLTGDAGNVQALRVRAERAGFDVEVVKVGVGEELPAEADVVVIGNGPLSALRGVIDDLRRHRDTLESWVSDEMALLAMGAGAEALSQGIDLLDGGSIEGLGIFPFRVERTRDRRVGYIVASTPHGRLIGFEDHASTWHVSSPESVYGTVTAGIGSFVRDGVRQETVRRANAFATNVQGPVLPLNPRVTDEMLRGAAERAGLTYTVTEAHARLDEFADGARRAIESYIGDEVFTYMQV